MNVVRVVITVLHIAYKLHFLKRCFILRSVRYALPQHKSRIVGRPVSVCIHYYTLCYLYRKRAWKSSHTACPLPQVLQHPMKCLQLHFPRLEKQPHFGPVDSHLYYGIPLHFIQNSRTRWVSKFSFYMMIITKYICGALQNPITFMFQSDNFVQYATCNLQVAKVTVCFSITSTNRKILEGTKPAEGYRKIITMNVYYDVIYYKINTTFNSNIKLTTGSPCRQHQMCFPPNQPQPVL